MSIFYKVKKKSKYIIENLFVLLNKVNKNFEIVVYIIRYVLYKYYLFLFVYY